MPEFAVVEGTPDSPWAVEAYHELDLAHSLEVFGEDMTISAERTREFLASQDSGLHVLLLVIPRTAAATTPGRFGLPLAPDSPVEVHGVALLTLPTADNQHLVDDLFVMVAAGSRRRGVATALLEQVRRIARESGRDTVLAWSEHRTTAASAALPQLTAPTGTGSLPVDGNVGFLRAAGFELAQVERMSRLELPTAAGLLARLQAEAQEVAGSAYRVVSWLGEVPEQYLEPVAALYAAMSTDAPQGEIDFREEKWDAGRVRRHDRELLQSGELVQTVALSIDDGRAAGHTVMFVPQASPHRPEQHNTVVLADHRGHRLGLWIKAANLALLEAEFPQVQHIDTWNADENNHMLAINTAIGYRQLGVTGAWQLRLT